jgi:hypothetical protein
LARLASRCFASGTASRRRSFACSCSSASSNRST